MPGIDDVGEVLFSRRFEATVRGSMKGLRRQTMPRSREMGVAVRLAFRGSPRISWVSPVSVDWFAFAHFKALGHELPVLVAEARHPRRRLTNGSRARWWT